MDKLAVSLALILASAAAPATSLKFHCDAAESANAVYHLACLAGHIPCTQDVFERFWHDTLQWTAADQRELDAWEPASVRDDTSSVRLGANEESPFW